MPAVFASARPVAVIFMLVPLLFLGVGAWQVVSQHLRITGHQPGPAARRSFQP
jgi:hypothetical protein